VGTNDAYQGYGSLVSDWYFDRIRHVLDTGQYANALWLRRLTCSLTCGSPSTGDAPIWISGGVNHQIVDAVVELAGYVNGYVAGLVGVQNAIVFNPIGVDAGGTQSGWAYFGTGSTDNLVIGGYRENAYPIVEVAGVAGKNKVISSMQQDGGVVVLTSTNTGMSSTSGATATVVLNTATADPGSWANTSTGVITVKIAGRYQVNGQIAYGTGAGGPTTGQVAAAIMQNGSATTIGGRSAASGPLSTVLACGILDLRVGDTVSLQSFQTSGSSQTIYGPNCWLSIARKS
jgi:hypothetical protein